MSEETNPLPARLQEIVEEFEYCEGREKIELLLDYAGRLPELPDWLRDEHDTMEQVEECMTPVFVKSSLQDGGMIFYFDVPQESPTVRGFAAVMAEGLGGASPSQVLAVPNDFFFAMGLERVLTMQRLNGMSAILAYMKRLAAQAMEG
jgi:cysteine desulfuration protein SufE